MGGSGKSVVGGNDSIGGDGSVIDDLLVHGLKPKGIDHRLGGNLLGIRRGLGRFTRIEQTNYYKRQKKCRDWIINMYCFSLQELKMR